jgi:AP endonuclease-2
MAEKVTTAPPAKAEAATPFGLARAAFDSIDSPQSSTPPPKSEASSSRPRSRSKSTTIDLTADETTSSIQTNGSSQIAKPSKQVTGKTKKPTKAPIPSQTKLSNFFAQPPSTAKRKSPSSPEVRQVVKRQLSSPAAAAERGAEPLVDIDIPAQEQEPDAEEEALIARAVAEADQERSQQRAVQNAKAAPKWNELFAKKLPPLCTVHQKPCKDFSKPLIATLGDVTLIHKRSKYQVQIRGRGSGFVHCTSVWYST